MTSDPFLIEPQTGQHREYIEKPILTFLLRQGFSSLLDSACGIGSWGFLLRMNVSERPFPFMVGLDVRKEFLKRLEPFRIYDSLIHWDLYDLPLPFESNSFEIVLSCETLEHLLKPNSLALIEEYERIARRFIVCSTPHHQKYMTSFHEAFPELNHVSSWSVKDFRRLGFHAFAFGRTSHLPRSLIPFNRLRCLLMRKPYLDASSIIAIKKVKG